MSDTQQASLTLTLPTGWQHLHPERMLDDLIAEAGDPGLTESIGEALALNIRETLLGVRGVYDEGNIVVTALRERFDPTAIDVLTVALPEPNPRNTEAVKTDDSSASGADREQSDLVHFEGTSAISHRSLSNADESAGFFAAHVQLVLCIPQSDRGAIVTLVSTGAGTEDLLERDAEEIAGSLRVTEAETEPAEPAGDTAI